MTRITNLQELRAEKQRLITELRIEKAIIDEEVRLVKEQLEPVRKALSFVGILRKKETDSTAQSLLKTGANLGIDLVGHRVLSKAGWVSRLVVPLIAKGLSSKLVGRLLGRKS